ncbi:5960_t:CDS:1, partial [Paraglomus occultum]
MANYLSRLKKKPFPDYVKKRVKEEIRKIQGSFFWQSNERTKE